MPHLVIGDAAAARHPLATRNNTVPCPLRATSLVRRFSWLVAGIAFFAAPVAPVADVVTETVTFRYSNMTWDSGTKARIEADLQRTLAKKGIRVAALEIAGAAQATFNGGVEHEDSWEQQTIIGGCGPARQVCLVIVCRNCRAAR